VLAREGAPINTGKALPAARAALSR